MREPRALISDSRAFRQCIPHNGDSTRVGSKIMTLRWKAERSGKLLELAPGVAVEGPLCSIVVGDRLSEIEVGGRLGHDRDSESG
jgi:hypothetical protein